MTDPIQPRPRLTWNTRFPMMLSFVVLALLVLLLGVWGMRASIAGAVMGSGKIEASKIMTAVQHPVGGVVNEILITDGDRVEAGDVVVRLEDAQIRSDLAVAEDNLFEVLANITRLEAIIDGRAELDLSAELSHAAETSPEVAILLKRQARQLTAHYQTMKTETNLLDKQKSQVNAQILGLEAQVAAKNEEMRYIILEMARLDNLESRGLLKQADRFNMQKSQTAVGGEVGRLNAKIAEMRGRMAEIELKQHMIEPKEIRIAVAELSRLRPERTKYLERCASLRQQLRKMEITAPISGRIHNISIQGLRSVVVAARPLMMIVPDTQPRTVTVRIRDTDIDQVALGQSASLKFRAFDGRNMPIILANVKTVSADALMDQTTRKLYYNVSLEFEDSELLKLGDRELVPGMPVEAFLSTESRTPLNYVLRPLKTYFDRAFRDA